MSAWVDTVIDLIRAAAFDEVKRKISASSSLEDLHILEQTLKSANWAGRLDVRGVMAAIRDRIAALSAPQEAAPPTPDDDLSP